VPVREWAECLDKAAPLVAAARARLAPGLTPAPVWTPERAAAGVFETLLSYGPRVLRLAAHLARLDRSCRELYGRGVPEDLSARVSRAAAEQTSGAGRHAVRIFAEPRPSGLAFTVTVGSVGSRTAESRLVYGVRGPGPWRHKWHDRSDLVRAESAAGDRQPYFVTGEGDVAETSRGNLFCRTADGLWLTPPLDEDVLPGVTRRDVLDLFADHQLDVSLQPFSPHTLKTASAAFWTSSLSGAVSVTEVDSVALPRAPAVLDLVNKALGFDPPQYPGPNAHPNVSDG